MGAEISSNTANFSSKLDVELYEAVDLNHLQQTKQLLNKGAQYNITTLDGKTALSLAIEKNNTSIINIFTNVLDRQYDVVYKRLYFYVVFNDYRNLENYFEVIDYDWSEINVNYTTSKLKITSLHISVIKKDIKTCKLLIKHGAEIDILDVNDDTPLMYAASIQSEEMIRFLLLHRANPMLKNKFGKKARNFILPGKTDLMGLLMVAEDIIPLLILAHKNDPNSSLYKDNLAPDVFKQIIRLLL